MKFIVLTLFPGMAEAFFKHGMIFRGIEKRLITGDCINIRDFSTDRHHTVDDRPYGGGSGMIMKPEPLKAAILSAKKKAPKAKVVLMTPQGRRFNQKYAEQLAGVDERIYTQWVDEEISMGDYVLTGGELAAMAVIDSVTRLVPGVLGSCQSPLSDSFSHDRLEYAQYTRPEAFDGLSVPDILLSGNHEKIRLWRKMSSLKRTFLKRPDLLEAMDLDEEEKSMVRQWCRELEILVND
jgi:tRNA (guanine37-N1)-methyltransferase